MKKSLSGWQNEFTIEDIEEWCGDYDKQWKQDIRGRISQKEYGSILDVGAGCCSEYYGFKSDNYEIDYTATDITPRYVKYSKSKGINVVLADMENMPFDDESFDCCICLDVMTHQLDYKKSIIELLRVAKKEVIITFFKPFLEHAVFGEQVIFTAPGEPLGSFIQLEDTNSIFPVGKKVQCPPNAHTSGLYSIVKIYEPQGLYQGLFSAYEERVLDQNMEPICVYSFFRKACLIEFLNTLDVAYTFETQKENDGKTNLFLEKKN